MDESNNELRLAEALCQALNDADYGETKRIIESGASVNASCADDSGSSKLVLELVGEKFQTNPDKLSLVHLMVERDLDVTKKYSSLAIGLAPKDTISNASPLAWVVADNGRHADVPARASLAALMLSKGANVNEEIAEQPLVFYAVNAKDEGVASALLDGAEVKLRHVYHLFYSAVEQGLSNSLLKKVLTNGTGISASDLNKDGDSAVFVALKFGDDEILRLVLDKFSASDLKRTRSKGRNALHAAVEPKDVKLNLISTVVDKFKLYRIPLDEKTEYGFPVMGRDFLTAEDMAELNERPDIVEFLNPARKAIQVPSVPTTQALQTQLCTAVETNNAVSLKDALDKGANPLIAVCVTNKDPLTLSLEKQEKNIILDLFRYSHYRLSNASNALKFGLEKKWDISDLVLIVDKGKIDLIQDISRVIPRGDLPSRVLRGYDYAIHEKDERFLELLLAKNISVVYRSELKDNQTSVELNALFQAIDGDFSHGGSDQLTYVKKIVEKIPAGPSRTDFVNAPQKDLTGTVMYSPIQLAIAKGRSQELKDYLVSQGARMPDESKIVQQVYEYCLGLIRSEDSVLANEIEGAMLSHSVSQALSDKISTLLGKTFVKYHKLVVTGSAADKDQNVLLRDNAKACNIEKIIQKYIMQ